MFLATIMADTLAKRARTHHEIKQKARSKAKQPKLKKEMKAGRWITKKINTCKP